ncbi:hypothetical protein B0T22DRAFT_437962 [Podospora appendiculata]|uniref:SET domain-containing protein n=1 Tax=Podospora appendiculata TaxID=314037 RepID=A0AAE1CHV0_9PEZI|nr:hypothetical protein B0T22DRAFT_437962 [Podospora appendiculata]
MLSSHETAMLIELPQLDEAPPFPCSDDNGGKQKQKPNTPSASLSIDDGKKPEDIPAYSIPATSESSAQPLENPVENDTEQQQVEQTSTVTPPTSAPGGKRQKHQNPFEIRPSPLGGLGAFAARDLKAGELILVEQPLLRTTTFDLLRSFRELDDEAKEVYMGLHSVPFGTNAVENIKQANAFHIPGSAAIAVFATASRFNHACAPVCNVQFAISSGSTTAGTFITLTMCKDAPRGAELLISYGGTPYQLLTTFGFRCRCGGCQPRSLRDLAVMRGDKEQDWWW